MTVRFLALRKQGVGRVPRLPASLHAPVVSLGLFGLGLYCPPFLSQAPRDSCWMVTMTQPGPDPDNYPPIDPTEPVPDDPGPLSPDTPETLPPAPVEPMPGPDDPDSVPAGGSA